MLDGDTADTTDGVFVSNNPYMIEKRMDVSTNTRSSTGAVRSERRSRRVWCEAYFALLRLAINRVRVRLHYTYSDWTQEQIDIIESHNFIGEITRVNPRTFELLVSFGDVDVEVESSDIELLE